METGVSKRPRNNPLTQQRMKAFHPIHSFRSSVIILTVVFLLLFSMGLALCLKAAGEQYAEVRELGIRYDEKCAVEPGKTVLCRVDFEVEDTLQGPVLMYYKLVNFYQNHRAFVKSRDYKQLAGKVGTSVDNCAPVDESEDISPALHMLDGRVLDVDARLNPCGIAAKSVFNGEDYADSFQLLTGDNGQLYIDTEDISWESDRDYMFKRPGNYTAIQWLDVKDGKAHAEHFIVWMRSAGHSTFLKLWGRVEDSIPPGNYTLLVENRKYQPGYDVSRWSGEKHVFLCSPTLWGGSSSFLGALYMAGSGVCLVFLLYLWLKRHSVVQVASEDGDLKWE